MALTPASAPGAAERAEHTAGAVARLDAWLQSMRVAPAAPATPGFAAGYGGPVAHWWRDSLLYCGPAFDWRYEGIVAGYLSLYRGTGQRSWLDRAIRAGEDLVAAQLPGGGYPSSGFEQNPTTSGTPHEAAADVALLELAAVLRGQADPRWSRYAAAAQRNLERFYIGGLWDDGSRLFRDRPDVDSFVPNKAATLVEALLKLAHLTGSDEWVERFAYPTLDAILRHQVPSGPLAGAIAQNSLRGAVVEKFFPYYSARCIPALVAAAALSQARRYTEAAIAAGQFVLRTRDPDGGFPQVVYAGGRVNRYPRWIAGTGDVLRCLSLLVPHVPASALQQTHAWLLAGATPGGAIRVAEGFGSQVTQRTPTGPPDARDLLPVAGWNDKAFRYLASLVAAPLPSTRVEPVRTPCTWQGRPAVYYEDEERVEVTAAAGVCYRWRKGTIWAQRGTGGGAEER